MTQHYCFSGCIYSTCPKCFTKYCARELHVCNKGMPKLISFSGFAFAGKDAAADTLVEKHDYFKTYMSKPLENALLTLNPLVGWGPKNGLIRYVDLHAEVGYDKTKEIPEVRRLLQTLGTEIGREMFGEDAWLNLVFQEIEGRQRKGQNVCLTGVRYRNELDRVHANGGVSFWINRPSVVAVNSHTSEHTLQPSDCTVEINNNGTLEDLYGKICALLLWEGYSVS